MHSPVFLLLTMTKPLRSCFTFLALLGTLLVTGCNVGPRELSGLTVKVDGIRSFNVRDGQSELVVTMRLFNETLRAIGIRDMDLTLTVNGIKLGTAKSTKPLATQALNSNTQDVAFVIDNTATLGRLKDALRKGAINYELTTRVTVLAADDEMTSKSSSSGSIEFNAFTLNLDD